MSPLGYVGSRGSEFSEIGPFAKDLVSAVAQNNITHVCMALAGHLPISMEDRSCAIIKAAEHNHWYILKLLLPKEAHISFEDMRQATQVAKEAGSLESLNYLRSFLYVEPIDEAGDDGVSESKGDDEPIIETLPEYSISHMRAIWKAVDEDDLEQIRSLVPLIELRVTRPGELVPSNRAQREAIFSASRSGKMSIMRYVLPPRAQISTQDRGLAVCSAVKYGDLSMVQYLLPLGIGSIYMYDQDRALEEAARYRHFEIIKYLWPEPSILSEKARGMAASAAAEHGHLDVIQYLFPLGPDFIPIKYKMQALENAAIYSFFKLVKYLCPDPSKIPDKFRGVLAEASSWRASLYQGDFARSDDDHWEIFEYLILSGPVLNPIIDRAVEAAARENRLDIVQKLLPFGAEMHEHFRAYSILCAVSYNNFEMLKWLLPEGCSWDMPELRKSLIMWAQNNQNNQMVKYLKRRFSRSYCTIS
jgi:ankyrin repeat protein